MSAASSFHRRSVLIAGMALLAPFAEAWGAAQGRTRVVTMLGDSITAGYGLGAAQALPARLQAELDRAGAHATVRAAGVSGDTTAGGLARVDFSVRKDTDVCVVALGGNDLLQGADTKAMRRNLDGIVRRLKARHIAVVLAGLKAPQVIGRTYARDYEAAFAAVAKANNVIFLPDLLGPVALNAKLVQADGIHPNPQGAVIVAKRLAPLVERALRTRG